MKRLRNGLKHLKDSLLQIRVIRLITATVEGAVEHDAAQRAAGVAYYSLLSIFPLILGLIAVFGFFLPSVDFQNELLKFIDNNVPGAADFLRQNINHIIDLRGGMGIISIVVLLWGASAMFGAINLSINRAWEVRRHRRPFLLRKASEIGMMIGLGILFLLSVGAGHVISILRDVTDLAMADRLIVQVGSRVVAFILIFLVFLLLYYLIPAKKTYWRYTWPGALLAAVFFEVARALFILYLENLVNFQYLYGSIASIIVLLVWIYYSAFIMILGAEFTFQYTRLKQPPSDG
jgi:membrane protein